MERFMNNVIDFLENIGTNSEYQLNRDELSMAVGNSELDEEVKQAILAQDHQKLEMLLDARTTIRCMLFPAEEDQPDKEDDKDEKDDADISNRNEHLSAAVG